MFQRLKKTFLCMTLTVVFAIAGKASAVDVTFRIIDQFGADLPLASLIQLSPGYNLPYVPGGVTAVGARVDELAHQTTRFSQLGVGYDVEALAALWEEPLEQAVAGAPRASRQPHRGGVADVADDPQLGVGLEAQRAPAVEAHPLHCAAGE